MVLKFWAQDATMPAQGVPPKLEGALRGHLPIRHLCPRVPALGFGPKLWIWEGHVSTNKYTELETLQAFGPLAQVAPANLL